MNLIEMNNPGAIRYVSGNKWQGQTEPVKGFATFSSMGYGARAQIKLWLNYIALGKNTLQKIIPTYAPPSENKTDAYIKYLADKTGVSPNQILKTSDRDDLIKLTHAQGEYETGKPIDIQVYIDAWNSFKTGMKGHIPLIAIGSISFF